MAHKGPGDAPTYDASHTSALRIGILHTRWNTPIVSSLLQGCLKTLHASGVRPENITVQSVPGSYELPFAAQRMYTASTVASSSSLVSAATDLLGVTGAAVGIDSAYTSAAPTSNDTSSQGATISGPLDAIIAIGVLIKGSTMHFEYISEAVTHGLMRVQLDTGCPVIFGVLTCLTEEQAHTRAGMVEGGAKEGVSHGESGHNHGEDWGMAAVEMAVKRKGWGEGRFL